MDHSSFPVRIISLSPKYYQKISPLNQGVLMGFTELWEIPLPVAGKTSANANRCEGYENTQKGTPNLPLPLALPSAY